MISNYKIRPEDQHDLNSRELKCMEEEDYFELEEEKKEEKQVVHRNGNYEKENKFLTDVSSESDSSSEADYKMNSFKAVKTLMNKKIEEEEEGKVAFRHNNGLSRTSSIASIDKITNKIDIQLNLRNLSEDNLSATEELHVKRIGSDLDLDDDIREESKLETVKRVKL